MTRRNPKGTIRPRLEALEDRVNPVANDLFADAEVLTGETAYVFLRANYDLFGTVDPFTGEPGEPNHAGVVRPGPVGVVPVDRPDQRAGVRRARSTSASPTVGVAAAVYTGDAVDALTEVASGIGRVRRGPDLRRGGRDHVLDRGGQPGRRAGRRSTCGWRCSSRRPTTTSRTRSS